MDLHSSTSRNLHFYNKYNLNSRYDFDFCFWTNFDTIEENTHSLLDVKHLCCPSFNKKLKTVDLKWAIYCYLLKKKLLPGEK